MRNLFLLLTIIFLSLGGIFFVYKKFSSGLDNQESVIEINSTIDTKELIESELYNVKNFIDKTFESKIRKLIAKNKNKINSYNCKGILIDLNNDSKYDSPFFDLIIEGIPSNIVIRYNFCSFMWDKHEVLVLTGTTKKLMDKAIKIEGVDKFVPAYILKTAIQNDEKVKVSEIGYVPISMFLIK